MMAQPIDNDRPNYMEDRHYTIAELADLWHISTLTLRRWFEAEPDVPNFGSTDAKGRRKRPYICVRIPKSVALRVYLRNVNQPPDSL